MEQTKTVTTDKTGVVLSNKMDKTLVVEVTRVCRHPTYNKVIKRRKKYYAHHNGDKEYSIGDTVTIRESRPMSKLKRWRVVA